MDFFRKMLRTKIHRATVTDRNVDYEGSISIPIGLLAEARIVPYEAVNIWNVTRGTRFETYAIEERESERAICVNGAAAHLVEPGDLVIIACFAFVPASSVGIHEPTVVFVDANNRIVEKRAEVSGRRAGKTLRNLSDG